MIDHLVSALESTLGLESVWLYGSRARGEITGPESDVDLLVITAGGWADLGHVTRELHRVAEADGVDPTGFSAMVLDHDRVERRRVIASFFMQEVDRDKIVVYGRP